jgi:hypothetical protein
MTLFFHLRAHLFGQHKEKISIGRPKPMRKITTLKWALKAQAWGAAEFD